MKDAVTLRGWVKGDAPVLQSLANNANISKNLMNRFPYPYSIDNANEFITMANQEDNYVFAILLKEEVVGAIGLHPQSDIFYKNAELGYWVGEPYWGQGVASSAIRKIVLFGFQNLNIDRIFARPFGTNIASQKALVKNGFVMEARLHDTIEKDGVTYDELIYSVRRPK